MDQRTKKHEEWTPLERTIAAHVKPRIPLPLYEFIAFGLKMAWASLYAGIMLALLIITSLAWQPEWSLARYDFLFIAAIALQISLLVFKLETPKEALVILIYHVVGTIMEIFKTHMGSWSYPEANVIRLYGVPLFTGFMYAAVGSFMVRAIRMFDMRFTHYPRFWVPAVIAVAIYANFFLHHYTMDKRYVIFAVIFIVHYKTRIYFSPDSRMLHMPFLLAAFLTALFLWVAENIGTITGTWIYPDQHVWKPVSFAKTGSWFLLLYLSFVLVTLVHKPKSLE